MGALRVHVRGMTIELEGDDPRAQQIAALLLGPLAPPEPEPVPPPALSPEALAFWDSLEVLDRRLLLLLAEKPCTPMELEQATGDQPESLHIRHRRITLRARKAKFGLRVRAKGRVRRERLFRIDDAFVDIVRRLAVTPAPV